MRRLIQYLKRKLGTSPSYSQQVTSDFACEVQEVGGKCQKFNQLANVSFSETIVSGVTHSVSNGLVSRTGTATSSTNMNIATDIKIVENHKYLLSTSASMPIHSISSNFIQIVYGDSFARIKENDSNNSIIFTASESSTSALIRCRIENTYAYNDSFYCNLFDLTAMYGAGNEPTLAQFKAQFPLDYYPYNSGSIIEGKCDEVVSKGINQWDEEWEIGNWGITTGEKGTLTDRIRCKSHIKVTPNTRYYIKGSATYSGKMCAYDINKTFLGTIANTGEIGNYTFKTNKYLDIPSNVHYITFNFLTDYGTTYNHDISINYPSSDTSYHPYHKDTMTIPSQILALDGYGWSINNTCYNYVDMVEKKFHKKVGRVDLGSLTCAYNSSVFRCVVGDTLNHSNNVLIYPYEITDDRGESAPDMSIYNKDSYYGSDKVGIKNSNYTDATAFKTAMDGVYLYYELATEVVTDISQYLTDKIMEVEDGGTMTLHQLDDTRLLLPNKISYQKY